MHTNMLLIGLNTTTTIPIPLQNWLAIIPLPTKMKYVFILAMTTNGNTNGWISMQKVHPVYLAAVQVGTDT